MLGFRHTGVNIVKLDGNSCHVWLRTLNSSEEPNPLPANHDNCRFWSVLFADETTVIGNKITI